MGGGSSLPCPCRRGPGVWEGGRRSAESPARGRAGGHTCGHARGSRRRRNAEPSWQPSSQYHSQWPSKPTFLELTGNAFFARHSVRREMPSCFASSRRSFEGCGVPPCRRFRRNSIARSSFGDGPPSSSRSSAESRVGPFDHDSATVDDELIAVVAGGEVALHKDDHAHIGLLGMNPHQELGTHGARDPDRPHRPILSTGRLALPGGAERGGWRSRSPRRSPAAAPGLSGRPNRGAGCRRPEWAIGGQRSRDRPGSPRRSAGGSRTWVSVLTPRAAAPRPGCGFAKDMNPPEVGPSHLEPRANRVLPRRPRR